MIDFLRNECITIGYDLTKMSFCLDLLIIKPDKGFKNRIKTTDIRKI